MDLGTDYCYAGVLALLRSLTQCVRRVLGEMQLLALVACSSDAF